MASCLLNQPEPQELLWTERVFRVGTQQLRHWRRALGAEAVPGGPATENTSRFQGSADEDGKGDDDDEKIMWKGRMTRIKRSSARGRYEGSTWMYTGVLVSGFEDPQKQPASARPRCFRTGSEADDTTTCYKGTASPQP